MRHPRREVTCILYVIHAYICIISIYIINIKDFDIQVNTRIYLTGFLASSIRIIFSCAHGMTNFASDNLPLSSDAGWKFRQVGPAVVDAPWLID